MAILLFLTIIIILVLITIIFRLLHKNRKLLNCIKENEEYKILRILAFTDALTGIYNRAAYNRHILDINKSDIADGLGIMLFDVDDFKMINDTKGHLAGDEVLKLVAQTLTLVFPQPKNNVYRMGGDEFAVISKGITEDGLIESLIKLREALGKVSDIRLSSGYSIVKENINSSFRYADEMMYADKYSKKK